MIASQDRFIYIYDIFSVLYQIILEQSQEFIELNLVKYYLNISTL